MDTAARTFLFDLLNTPSPTGFELPGQRKWAAYARRFADRVENDAYGTAWATLDGTAKKPRRVMLEAHADEIGFIVKHITKEGWLRIDRIGGSDTATARGRRIDLLGEKGTVAGIIGNTAIHLRKDSSATRKRRRSTSFMSMSEPAPTRKSPPSASASATLPSITMPPNLSAKTASSAARSITASAASSSPKSSPASAARKRNRAPRSSP